MRVLHVYRTYFPETQGGLEEVIRQICLNTRRHGVVSRVLCASPSIRPRVVRRKEAAVYRSRLNVEIASCDLSFQALGLFRRMLKWADVVHYHFPWPFADMLHFAARVRSPTVLTYHSDIVRQRVLAALYSPLMLRFLRSMDRIVCTSPNYFATSPVLQRFEDKVEILPIGLDPDSYPSPERAEVAAERARYGEGFFLFIGVLRYYKGLHILLEAIQGAPYRVVIVGSGPTEAELKKQARDLRLNNVAFAGQVSDRTKVALIELSRAVVFPSSMRSEAFGVTLLEGCYAGQAADFHGGRFGHQPCQCGRRDGSSGDAGVAQGTARSDGPLASLSSPSAHHGRGCAQSLRATVQRPPDGATATLASTRRSPTTTGRTPNRQCRRLGRDSAVGQGRSARTCASRSTVGPSTTPIPVSASTPTRCSPA